MSNNLGLSQIAATQSNKHVTANDQVGQLDAALTGILSVAVDDTNAASLTTEQLQRHFFFEIDPDTTPPDAAVMITVPAIRRGMFAAHNNTAQAVTITITGQSEAAPVIAAGEAALLSSDGSDVRAEGTDGGGSSSYDFGFSFAGTPTSLQVLSKVVVPRDVTLPANMAGAAGDVDTGPTTQYDIDVTDDGSSIGTISISTAGAFTFTTAGGTAKAIAAGSVIRFIGNITADATVANIAATLQAFED